MKYFVPDSVASEVHEREIADERVAGLPLMQAVAMIAAYDAYNIEGDESLEHEDDHRECMEGNDIGVLLVNTDRAHWYGIVFSPTNERGAKARAEEVLREWEGDEEE